MQGRTRISFISEYRVFSSNTAFAAKVSNPKAPPAPKKQPYGSSFGMSVHNRHGGERGARGGGARLESESFAPAKGAVKKVPGKKEGPNNDYKQPVLFQHGIFDSSDGWVCNGFHSLPFIFAEHNFDVWLANSRGNKYCKNHDKFKKNSFEFWQFSFHDLGIYDIPDDAGTIKVKITDLLSESIEVEV